MATTVPGGRYLQADGKTWVDAEGKPVPAPVEVAPEVEPEPAADVQPVVEPVAEEPAKKSKK